MKKIKLNKIVVVLLIIVAIIVSIFVIRQKSSGKYNPGTYTGTADSVGGAVEVSVKVDRDKILSVAVTSNKDTEGIGTKAIEQIPGAIVNKQSTKVDTVSGATGTSKAIISAVESALKKAKGTGTKSAASTVKDGTYEAMAKGRKGNLKVSVTFANNAIKEVKVLEHRETDGISDIPLKQIPEQIVKNQSVAVDGVTGATFTSNGIKNAVKDAITKAGGSEDRFNKTVEKPAAKTDIVKENVDLVVVGGGPAGLMAAKTAAEAGKKVLLFEKLPYVGGNLLSAAGHISAAGSKIQVQNGIEKLPEKYRSPENYLASRIVTAQEKSSPYYKENPVFTRLFFEKNVQTVNELIDAGVKFMPNPTSVSHVLQPGDFKGCGIFADWLVEKITSAGGRIITSAPVTEITSKDGAANGVVAQGTDGTKYNVNAKSVIVATGGWTSNKEMIGKYYPELKNLYSTAQISTQGDGVKMTGSLGVDTYAMDSGVHKLYVTSKSKNEIPFFLFYVPAIAVNANGERFINEYENYSINCGKMLQPENGGYSYFIFDENSKKTAEKDYMGLIELGDIIEYSSVEEAAKALNTPKLKATIEEYNKMAAAGKDTAFGNPTIKPLTGSKVYAMKVEPGLYLTYGGLKVDMNMRALDAKGNPVSGLYAAGDAAGSIEVQEGFRYTAGVTQALTFGKISAETAIKDMK